MTTHADAADDGDGRRPGRAAIAGIFQPTPTDRPARHNETRENVATDRARRRRSARVVFFPSRSSSRRTREGTDERRKESTNERFVN